MKLTETQKILGLMQSVQVIERDYKTNPFHDNEEYKKGFQDAVDYMKRSVLVWFSENESVVEINNQPKAIKIIHR